MTTVNGQPVSKTAPANDAATTDKKSTHTKECGDVGKTGEHGDLGTNAAK